MSEYKKTVGICSVRGKPIFSGELNVGHKTKILYDAIMVVPCAD